MSKTEIYCECCGGFKPLTIKMEKDVSFPDQGIWGDILCSDCSFVIASVQGDESGEYEIVKKAVTEKMEHYEKALKAIKHHIETIGEGNGMPPTAYSIVCECLEYK